MTQHSENTGFPNAGAEEGARAPAPVGQTAGLPDDIGWEPDKTGLTAPYSQPPLAEAPQEDTGQSATAQTAAGQAAAADHRVTGLRHPPWGGLSGKLLFLTIAFVMLAEVLIYVPSVANFRNSWLQDRLTTAGVAAAVLSETNTVAPRFQEELLRATGASAIALDFGTRRSLIAMSETALDIDMVADMTAVTPWQAVLQSFETLGYTGDGLLRVVGQGHIGQVKQVDVVLPIRLLRNDMLAFSWRILGLSLVISVITASLVYVSLRALLVRPLQQMARSMQRFGEDPEDPAAAMTLSPRHDEIGEAQVRLADMQQALARALSQKQRLADLGLAVSKINHDLRNLLASAQLFLERLEHVEDPTVRRLAPKIVATLDRAVGYTQAVMSYGKAQEQAPKRRVLNLSQLLLDVADVLGLSETSPIRFECKVPEDLEVDADPEQLFRVILNLCRNALQALEGELEPSLVRRITVDARRTGRRVEIRVADTGPGIPAEIRKSLFKAFHGGAKSGGVGLGLAIAAELLKAHGGSIALLGSTHGTAFLITVPDRVS